MKFLSQKCILRRIKKEDGEHLLFKKGEFIIHSSGLDMCIFLEDVSCKGETNLRALVIDFPDENGPIFDVNAREMSSYYVDSNANTWREAASNNKNNTEKFKEIIKHIKEIGTDAFINSPEEQQKLIMLLRLQHNSL